jgi:hypothetical protein
MVLCRSNMNPLGPGVSTMTDNPESDLDKSKIANALIDLFGPVDRQTGSITGAEPKRPDRRQFTPSSRV